MPNARKTRKEPPVSSLIEFDAENSRSDRLEQLREQRAERRRESEQSAVAL